MNDSEINQKETKRAVFLRFMRYVSVAIVSVWLCALMIASTDTDDEGFVQLIVAAIVVFYITIPVVRFWIYSFIKSVRRATKTDKVLLWFHIVDLLMLATCVYLVNQPPQKCDAFIMAQNCEGETGFWMRNIAHRYRGSLPDSTQLYAEFDKADIPQSDILSEQEMKQMKSILDDYCGCIGIEIDNYSRSGFSTIIFRRIGMELYSFRFYDHPLTREQQDSLNDNPCLIVYNDSTVFEFRTGVLGAQAFPGKKEFIENLNNHKNK